MPTKPKTFRPAGAPTKQEQRQRYDKQRGSASERGPYCTKWWAKKRQEIAVRDLYACQICGCMVGLKSGDFHCDHIEERPLGAPVNIRTHDADSNLRTLCVTCHSSRTMKEWRNR